ncbi:hypothetical protein [Stenotrophomonas sp.]|uniref:hypothetical protein n=1 Tax=Stenotrophomonas sp. TaxID=69392 RepID=UPI00289C954D|nr:hypothetical protein [Stenotrophomonas sp.]
MTTKSNPTPATVRAWLTENAIDAPWTSLAICEGCGAETVDQRSAVRDAVRYCVAAGFLARTQTKIGPVYQLTGQGMRRVVLTDAERKQRQRERDARRIRARRPPRTAPVKAPKRSRAARVNMQAANTPAPAKSKTVAQGETVEQFLARGGRVQRLTAHWEQTERAA